MRGDRARRYMAVANAIPPTSRLEGDSLLFMVFPDRSRLVIPVNSGLVCPSINLAVDLVMHERIMRAVDKIEPGERT